MKIGGNYYMRGDKHLFLAAWVVVLLVFEETGKGETWEFENQQTIHMPLK